MKNKVEATISSDEKIQQAFEILSGGKYEWKDLSSVSFTLIDVDAIRMSDDEFLVHIKNLHVVRDIITRSLFNPEAFTSQELENLIEFYQALNHYLSGVNAGRRMVNAWIR